MANNEMKIKETNIDENKNPKNTVNNANLQMEADPITPEEMLRILERKEEKLKEKMLKLAKKNEEKLMKLKGKEENEKMLKQARKNEEKLMKLKRKEEEVKEMKMNLDKAIKDGNGTANQIANSNPYRSKASNYHSHHSHNNHHYSNQDDLE
ncbi:hypothetical protein U732_459 [Clostridium argentinense CDC 2741]|uniref:Uncharacterized protein n=1 Tax=Clostridium argentinense CDC 2741 TaxID=1418104 RepID=A0A0C1R245_9CLOT|nr:hypothetical protein [Clostridium argentinense]ARC83949.1 hypothetical protein RSJ17_05110 [Clostridium argentinense]KIE44521.1 hypothetical protein U732_459 [Clostridium argentinense CDC 2741]NFF39446.1 hypothetical protein [Clostridium argentinense]NFP50349.1 hypothetical protein [Clostridium argentinense]NFP74231.1 hypothetical protein [Clostridium argentinense]